MDYDFALSNVAGRPTSDDRESGKEGERSNQTYQTVKIVNTEFVVTK